MLRSVYGLQRSRPSCIHLYGKILLHFVRADVCVCVCGPTYSSVGLSNFCVIDWCLLHVHSLLIWELRKNPPIPTGIL